MVADKPEWSLAFVHVTEPEDDFVRIKVGDSLGKAEVITIAAKQVTFLQDGKEKVLNLLGEEAVKAPKDNGKKPGKKDDISSKIKKVGPHKYEVEKSVVQDLMKNFATAGRGARVMPDAKGGFRVSFVRSYSLFFKLGVRSGDVIKSVNNIPLNSIQETLMLYTKLKNANHLTISVNRRGKTINMDYSIR